MIGEGQRRSCAGSGRCMHSPVREALRIKRRREGRWVRYQTVCRDPVVRDDNANECTDLLQRRDVYLSLNAAAEATLAALGSVSVEVAVHRRHCGPYDYNLWPTTVRYEIRRLLGQPVATAIA